MQALGVDWTTQGLQSLKGKHVKFRGWAVIELDSVPDKSKTPRECALISKKYVEEKLRMKI